MEEMKIRKVSDGYLGILDLPGQPAQVGKRKLRRDLERWRKETIVRWALTCKPEDLIACRLEFEGSWQTNGFT